jgi:hypothetical protein
MPRVTFVATFVVAPLLSVIFPWAAGAGTITFQDVVSNVTYLDDTGRVVLGGCSGESCILTVAFPAGATGMSTAVSPDIYILEPVGEPCFSSGVPVPGVQCLSDHIRIVEFGNQTAYRVYFDSNLDALGPGPSTGTILTEDGTVQSAIAINFTDSVGNVLGSDTIRFQSTEDTVPEPFSAALALAGLLVLGFRTICRFSSHRSMATTSCRPMAGVVVSTQSPVCRH